MASAQNVYGGETEAYEGQVFSETPFIDPRIHEQEPPLRDSQVGWSPAGNWEFTTPFLPGESTEAGEGEAEATELEAFSEITAELKDTLFREALEQLADEALEAHAEQLEGEYGDRETRDALAERLLNEHFAPLAEQTEAMLDRFFERVGTYEAESLTDTEIDRISNEVLPVGAPLSPASEQFLGGLLRKAGRLVSGAVNLAKKGVQGAVNLAGKGLSAVANLALGPLLAPLKALGRFLLKHVVKFALDKLPPALRPLAQKLSDRLFQAIGNEAEGEAYEQTESEAVPAAPDAARLEAEFDMQAAQLLLTPDETETEYLVSSYGEGESESENYSSPVHVLDDTRAQLSKQLSALQPGESAGPVMEQFVPALWPAAKAAIAVLGRGKIVSFLGNQLNGLIKPLIGAEPAKLLAPSIADAGLRIFGLETNQDPRAVASEALAATIEETVNAVAELPPHVLENETLLSDAVHEAFENAASAYFPNSVIRPAVRESVEHHGKWNRMPANSKSKRYAKYSDSLPVEISPRVAGGIDTFGSSSLRDHLRDHHGHRDGRSFKGKVSLYQALPGTRGSAIARAEGFPASQLHPLTPQAAGALLGQNAALGRHTAAPYLNTPQRLHVGQRLYRIEPAAGAHHHRHHPRPVHSEIVINLLRGEIRLWLYLSEPLAQEVLADLAKGNNAAAAFKRVKSMLRRITETLKTVGAHRHLPPQLQVVGSKPNLSGRVPHWLKLAAPHLGAKIGQWVQVQLAQYLQNSAEEFKRAVASHRDGVTLRFTMTKVPGMDLLHQLSRGQGPRDLLLAGWPGGSPAFHVVARPGYTIHRLRS
jgi:hypothetical protein